MLALLRAIKEQFVNAGTIHDAFPGGLYVNSRPVRKPGGAAITYPYAVLDVVPGSKQHCFGGPTRIEAVCRFTCVGDDSTVVGSAAESLESILSSTLLTGTGLNMVNCVSMHDPQPLPDEERPGESAQGLTEYLVTLAFSYRNS